MSGGPQNFRRFLKKTNKKLSEKQNRKKTLAIFGQGPKRALRRIPEFQKECSGESRSLRFTTSHLLLGASFYMISKFHCCEFPPVFKLPKTMGIWGAAHPYRNPCCPSPRSPLPRFGGRAVVRSAASIHTRCAGTPGHRRRP